MENETKNNGFVQDLIKLEGELVNPKTKAENPFLHSKYAPLDEVLNIIRPALLKHNFAIVQTLNMKEYIMYIKTSLIHITGERLESEVTIPQLNQDAQKIGAYITYMRRYSVLAMLNIVGEGEDDDAERVTEHAKTVGKPPTKAPQEKKNPRFEEVHTGNAYNDLKTELLLYTNKDKETAAKLLEEITTFIDPTTNEVIKGISTFKDLKPDSKQVGVALGKLREIKKQVQAREGVK